MLEIQCKGNLAAIAERVQAVLFADAGLKWLVQTNAPEDTFNDVPILKRMDDLFIHARNHILISERATVVRITILRDRLTWLGAVVLEARGVGCFMWADNPVRKRIERGSLGGKDVTVTEESSNDLQAITPIWERIVAELRRLGLVVEAKGGDRKRAADRGVSGHLPLSKELRKLWRRAYLVMCEFKRERLDDHDDIPTWQEYSERVLERLKWKREEQVLRWIMQEGEAGKLTEPK